MNGARSSAGVLVDIDLVARPKLRLSGWARVWLRSSRRRLGVQNFPNFLCQLPFSVGFVENWPVL
jgi:hypothetical protein